MAENEPQTYANHPRYDPIFHFVTFGALVVNFFLSIYWLVKNPGLASAWTLVMALVFLVFFFKIRSYPLGVQDRLIRLEERLRLTALLPEPLKARIPELSPRQLVGLRFASDDELPSLVERTLAGNLREGEIKKLVVKWRADTFRI
jgi:hypothetical protein